MTARRRSKKPPRKPSGKRGQSAPRSRVPEAEETDETDVLETPKQLEEELAHVERMATNGATAMVDALQGQARDKKGGDDALLIRLQKRESHHIAQAVRQFADRFFELLCADADDASRKFVRKIEQSDCLRDLIDYDQLSLERLGWLFQILTLIYIEGAAFESSRIAKIAEEVSTIPVSKLKKRKETLAEAARFLFDDSHSGEFPAPLRYKDLASQLVNPFFSYSLKLEFKRQLQRRLSGKPRKSGRPVDPFGRFIKIAYPILEPLTDPKRLDLIVTFGREFFGEETTRRKLRERLTHAGVRRPR